MGFDERLLNNDEEVLRDLRPHWWFVVPQIAVFVLALVVAIVALSLDAPRILQLVLASLCVIALAFLAIRWVRWITINFVITTDRLIFRSGVIAKRGIEIPLERVNTVFYQQTAFERIVGSGDLTIESAGEGGQQHFENVRRPRRIQQEIYRAIDINRDRGFASQAQAHADANAPHAATYSIPQQIEQLDVLRQRGVLTEAEFQTKKRELLDRM